MQQRILITLILIIQLIFTPFPPLAFAQADPYWVDDNGTETTWANCQSASPLSGSSACTFATAMSNASGSDQVWFRDGDYSDILDPDNSGTDADNMLKLWCYTGETCNLTATWRPWRHETDYVHTKNFKVTNLSLTSGSTNYAILITGDHNKIENPYYDGTPLTDTQLCQYEYDDYSGSYGIVFSGGDYNEVIDPIIRGVENTVVSFAENGTDAATNNYVHGTGTTFATATCDLSTSFDHIAYFDECDSESGNKCLNRIEYCKLHGSVRSDGVQSACYNASDCSTSAYNIIRNCWIYDNGENCFDLKGSNHYLIEDNYCWHNWGDNDWIYDDVTDDSQCATANGARTWTTAAIMRGSTAKQSDAHIIRRNYIFDNNAAGIAPYDNLWRIYWNTIIGNNAYWGGVSQSEGGSGVRTIYATDAHLINNLIAGHGRYEIQVSDSETAKIDGNLAWDDNTADPTVAPTGLTWDADGSEQSTLANWQSALTALGNISGNDTNGVASDPKLINVPSDWRPTDTPDNYDFGLDSNSPGIDAGVTFMSTAAAYSGAAGETTITLNDGETEYIFDGYGITGENPDYIKVGSNSCAQVKNGSRDDSANTVIVLATISGGSGETVEICVSSTAPYYGTARDIGAREYAGDQAPTLGDEPLEQDSTAIIDLSLTRNALAGVSASHDWTDWIVCTNGSSFTNCQASIVWSSYDDSSNKTSIDIPADTLTPNTNYWWTARTHNNDPYEGEWQTTLDAFSTTGSSPSGGDIAMRVAVTGFTGKWLIIDCQNQEGTGVLWVAGATGGKLYNTTLVNCGTVGLDADESVEVKNVLFRNNAGPDINVASGKTITCITNSIEDSGIQGSGTYTCTEDFSKPDPLIDVVNGIFKIWEGTEPVYGGTDIYAGEENDIYGRSVTNSSGEPVRNAAMPIGAVGTYFYRMKNQKRLLLRAP